MLYLYLAIITMQYVTVSLHNMQELLSLFGLPYLVAPGEAEAQCAALEELGLTEGSITDDSDIFLFGGQKVYRNFFAQDKDLEVYHESEIEKSLGKYVL